MAALRSDERWLNWLLWMGGVPPMLSGIVAVFFPQVYIRFVSEALPSLLGERNLALATLLFSMQGGDAFVAGSARVAVAVWGNRRLKQFMGAGAIMHSVFELWLLPTHVLQWCENYPEVSCTSGFLVEVWVFLALHLALVIGFALALLPRGLGLRS